MDVRTLHFMVMVGFGLSLAGPTASAQTADDSFVDGLAAYDAGDVAETVRIWKALASDGDANAQVGLAGLYRAGSGVARDLAEAARLYRLAAEQGDSNGQLNLGRLYLEGNGVKQNQAAAYAWLTLAARQGRRWAKEQRQKIEPLLSADQLISANALIAEIESR